MSLPRALLAATFGLPATGFAQTPDTIQGLQLWLDATDAGTINTSGGFVTQWDDKSGNGFHATQADPNRQPVVAAGVLGGQNAIQFDTTGPGDPNGDGLAIDPGLSVGRPYTAYIVDQYSAGATELRRTLQGTGQNWLLGKWGGNTAHFTGAWVGPNAGINAGTINTAISEGIGGPQSSRWSLNGRGFGGNTSAGAPGNLFLGQPGAAGNPPFDEPSQADVSEVLVFNRVLADNERNAVNSYLSDKYGLPAYQRHNSTRTQTFAATADLDFSGDFVAAVNARGPGGFSIGDASFTDDAGVITSENEILNWFPASFAEGDLNTVMQSIRWTATNGAGQENVTATVGGLTPGNTYKVQMLFGDAATARHFAVNINGSVVINDFSQAAHTGTATDMGVAVIHEFVATSNTLDVILDGTGKAGGDINPLIQGLTVENRGVTGVTTTGTFTSAGDLDFEGDFAYAVDVNGTGGFAIGDANFTGDNVAGVLVGAENSIALGGWGAPDYGATPDDDNLEMVMGSIRWEGNNNGFDDEWLSLDLQVDPGQEYKLQLLFAEGCCDRGFDVSIEEILVVDGLNLQTLGALQANNTGAVVTHLFTAGDDQLNVVLNGYSAAFTDINPILNGFTLEAIPEPSAALLAAFGGLLALRRRRP